MTTTTSSMYYTSVSLSQSQSVSTSVAKPAWARRLVFKEREEESKAKEDLVTSESVPRLQLHSVVTMVYPGVYNTASNNQRGTERKTTKGPEVYNTAASNTNNAFTHRPFATTTIAIVPTTTLTTESTTTTSTSTTSTTTTSTT